MYPYQVLLITIINFIILTKCSEITNEELLDCLLTGIKYGSKCDFLKGKQKNEQEIEQKVNKRKLVKVKVPHASDFNSVSLNNAFYKPLYRVHKHVPKTVFKVNDRSGIKYYDTSYLMHNPTPRLRFAKTKKDKQLKTQIKRFLGILNQRMSKKKIDSLLKKPAKYQRSKYENRPLNPPIIVFLNKGKGDISGKMISKVMLGSVARDGMEQRDEHGETPVDFRPDGGPANELDVKPIHAYNFWNYWTYDKPLVHDRCPGSLIEFHGMCIHHPPH